MKPSKEDKYYSWHKKTENPIPQPNIKIRIYTLTFNDKPEILHQIIISQNGDMFSYDVRFSKPLIHPVTKTKVNRDNVSCNNLNELKKLLKNWLNGFGEFTIIPL